MAAAAGSHNPLLDGPSALLRTVAAGGRFVSPVALQLRKKQEPRLDRLNEKELAVLQMIAGGKLNKEIADVLGLSIKAVDHHRQHLMTKLDLHNVADLTKFAVCQGMV